MTIRKGSEGPASIMCPGPPLDHKQRRKRLRLLRLRFRFDGDLHNDYD